MNTQAVSSNRRDFMKRSAIAGGAIALHFSVPQKLFAANSDTLKVGLIGCGGRGTGAARQALSADPNVVLHAMGDAFEDRLQGSLAQLKQAVPDKVHVTPETTFVGFDAYQKVLASGVDVVILATPPGFRPLHLTAAVEAGKHIFCEKPMAVDMTGVRTVLKAVEESKKKSISLVAGFCWRYNFGERAVMQQIHEGKIGDILAVQTNYYGGTIRGNPRKPGLTDMQYQMRNWYYNAWLSGDHIVEQAVHSIDKMNWALGDIIPTRATAIGGRQARFGEETGHIYDHFAVVYEFENGIRGYHLCRQQDGCSGDYSDMIIGTKGKGRIVAGGALEVRGETNWRYTGERPDMYQIEHNELFASIRSGNHINNGDWMTRSTMMAIMGRMSAYTGQPIEWDQALNAQENLLANATGNPEVQLSQLTWETPIHVPPVAIPGKTRIAFTRAEPAPQGK